jgi:hypothetical protein
MQIPMNASARDVGVVIAWYYAHVGWPSQGFKPAPRMDELGRQRDVDEIASNSDVVRLRSAKIVGDGIEGIPEMDAPAAALPVDVADEAFRREFLYARPRQRPEMRVGQMGQHECLTHQQLASLPTEPGDDARGVTRTGPNPTLGATDEDPGRKDEHAADDHLESRLKEWRVHVTVADIRDRSEFHCYDGK